MQRKGTTVTAAPGPRRVARTLFPALALALLGVAASPAPAQAELGEVTVTENMLAVRTGDIVLGSPQAPLTIVGYGEHHDTNYSILWMKTFRLLLNRYGNKLRIVVRDYPMPFHETAPLGSAAAHGIFERGGESAYLAFTDALINRAVPINPASLAAAAARVGAGPAPVFQAALQNKVWDGRVETNVADFKAANMHGTPTMFLNGRVLGDWIPNENMFPIIDAELAATRALEAKGMQGARASRERTRMNLAEINEKRAAEAAKEPAHLQTPVKVVFGSSIGPFYLGQTSEEVQRLGFDTSPDAGGRTLCVATNVGYQHPFCTFKLWFTRNAITQIDYFIDHTNDGVMIGDKNFPYRPGYQDLIAAIGNCTSTRNPDGTQTAPCPGGLSVYAGTGDGCSDRLGGVPATRCQGVRNIVRLRLSNGAETPSAPPPVPAAANQASQPPLLVPGRSFGPFTFGQSYQEIQQLGLPMRNVQRMMPQVCVATNPGSDLCTVYLTFTNNRLRSISYRLNLSTLGFRYANKRIPPDVRFDDLEKTLRCTPGEPAEGGTTSRCGQGVTIGMGTGGHCGERVSGRDSDPCMNTPAPGMDLFLTAP